MKISLIDYIVLRGQVEAVLSKLNFRLNPDHALVGGALLEILNQVGARLIYDSLKGKEQAVATTEQQHKEQVFEYLDALRESGATNMLGAGPYVQEEFGLGEQEARVLVVEWMETLEERHSV